MPMVGNSARKAFPMERLESNPENAEKSRTGDAMHAIKKKDTNKAERVKFCWKDEVSEVMLFSKGLGSPALKVKIAALEAKSTAGLGLQNLGVVGRDRPMRFVGETQVLGMVP